MTCHQPRLGALLLAAALAGCEESPTATPASPDPAIATASRGPLYQLQFVVIDPLTEGEITSAPFPAGGVSLNTKDPWRQLDVRSVFLALNDPTHGRWTSGTCASYSTSDVWVNWTIARTDPPRSFAGGWMGELSIWRSRWGMNLAFEGARSDGAPGQIRNVATNNNTVQEERGPGDAWFRLRFTDARMGFGSLSSPDGGGTLGELPGYEAACANFSILATRLP